MHLRDGVTKAMQRATRCQCEYCPSSTIYSKVSVYMNDKVLSSDISKFCTWWVTVYIPYLLSYLWCSKLKGKVNCTAALMSMYYNLHSSLSRFLTADLDFDCASGFTWSPVLTQVAWWTLTVRWCFLGRLSAGLGDGSGCEQLCGTGKVCEVTGLCIW